MSSLPPDGRGRGRGQALLHAASQAQMSSLPPDSRGRGRGQALIHAASQTTSTPVLGGSANAAMQQQHAAPRSSIALTRPIAPPTADPEDGGRFDEPMANLPAREGRVSIRPGRDLEIFRTRPPNIDSKNGTKGQPVELLSNYMRIIRRPDWKIYKYHISFAPEVSLNNLRKHLVSTQKEMFGGYLFDGTQLFCTRKLKQYITEKTIQARDGTEYSVTFKFTGEVAMTESVSLQILNLILRRAMGGLHLQLVNRNFFDADACISIPDFRMELWPGYQTSIRQHEQDILLCSEIAHKVMRTETIYNIMNKVKSEERDFRTVIQQRLLGQTVLTSYNNKTYRIDDIDFTKSPRSIFDTKDGPITFLDYYKNRYNLIIKDADQPLLISKAKLRNLRGGEDEFILLVPELCRATGITDEMRANFRLMKSMSEHTRVGPAGRISKLLEFNNRLRRTQASVQVLQDWDLELSKEILRVPARILPNEKIVFGGGVRKETSISKKFDWASEFRNNSMYHTVDLKRWFVITPRKAFREATEFVICIQNAVNGMRFNVSDPTIMQIPDDRLQTYTDKLDECINQNPQLIMCIVSNDKADRYAAIKKKCCVERPVPSQVVVHKTITPKGGKPGSLMSVATKVAIQMNCKLGGLPWLIELPLSGLMTIGFDVSHDTSDKKRSYGALVATMDLKQSNEFFSAVSSHTNGEELSNELCINVNEALIKYRENSGKLPERIIFYRDGVGDGQLPYVYEHELNSLKEKLKEVYKTDGHEEGPKFTFIVVSKRINTRIFKANENPPPGTVVDDVITLPEKYDFYLISQCIRDGTVSPTSYNILYDTSGLPADKIQILTYKFTHLYYNWSGPVRVPALCQYANKLASFIGQHVKKIPNLQLSNKLYFL